MSHHNQFRTLWYKSSFVPFDRSISVLLELVYLLGSNCFSVPWQFQTSWVRRDSICLDSSQSSIWLYLDRIMLLWQSSVHLIQCFWQVPILHSSQVAFCPFRVLTAKGSVNSSATGCSSGSWSGIRPNSTQGVSFIFWVLNSTTGFMNMTSRL